MNRRVLFALALLCALVVARISSAHHPLGELFDRDSMVVVTGTITSIQWVNPHVTFVLAVERDPAGTMWAVEVDPPGVLSRRGWNPTTVAVGTRVTITGFASLDGSPRTAAREIELPSGKRLTATTNASWMWQRAGDRLVFEIQPPNAR
jgi:hypothetical protein